MTANRIVLIIVIYVLVCVAWVCLGQVTSGRSTEAEQQLQAEVHALWGAPQAQVAPSFSVEQTTVPEREPLRRGGVVVDPKPRTEIHDLAPGSSDVRVNLTLDMRRKGLIWYSTYVVELDATYELSHAHEGDCTLVAQVPLPAMGAMYDCFEFSINGEQADLGPDLQSGVECRAEVPAGEPATARLYYISRGTDHWEYGFGETVSQVEDFTLTVTTNFGDFDFPVQSPTSYGRSGDQWQLIWHFDKLLAPKAIAIETPTPPSPGALASRISYYAPIGLLFFLSMVLIIGIAYDQNLHPMHYLLVCSAFFAFHLLFAYLVDRVEINLAFGISAVVSVLLVTSYLMRVLKPSFALGVVAPLQGLFLVLFSYAFFQSGMTGLTVTIGAIVTLATAMHLTAKVDWAEKLPSIDAPRQPPPTPAPPPAAAPHTSQRRPIGPSVHWDDDAGGEEE